MGEQLVHLVYQGQHIGKEEQRGDWEAREMAQGQIRQGLVSCDAAALAQPREKDREYGQFCADWLT